MRVLNWDFILSLFKDGGRMPCENGAGLCVGSFDGFHKGHRKLIQSLKDFCTQNCCKSVVLSFTRPLPSIKNSSDYEGDVSTLNQRLDFFESEGVDFLILVDFDKKFASLSGSDFFDIIKAVFNLKFIAEGVDFHCGYRGSTDCNAIKDWAQKNNVKTSFLPPVIFSGENQKEQRISSSIIRNLIKNGDVKTASLMLQKPYELDFSKIDRESIIDGTIKKSDFLQVIPQNGVFPVKILFSSGQILDSEISVSEGFIFCNAFKNCTENILKIVFFV